MLSLLHQTVDCYFGGCSLFWFRFLILDSQHIQLDENGEKVRANVKRCIIILREIPDSTPIQVS